MMELGHLINQLTAAIIHQSHLNLVKLSEGIQMGIPQLIYNAQIQLDDYTRQAKKYARHFVFRQEEILTLLTQIVEANRLEKILKKGFSITYYNGRLLQSARLPKEGDEVETLLHDGKVISRVVMKSN